MSTKSTPKEADVMVIFGITRDLVHSYDPGSCGSDAADSLVADYGGWREPWEQ
jgi:hypothetical protein